MVGKYKVKYDFTANEFGFVNTQAKKDNHDKVGGNSGVKKMIKQGKTVDQISKEFGMFKDAVKSMAEEAELKEFGVQDQDDYVAALNATMKDFGIKPPIHSHKFNSPAEKEKFDKAVDKKYAEISK